jgi:hypothetical protein
MLRFLVRSLTGALVLCASAQAQSIPVNVTNTAAHPVPTTITNTPAVTVTNPVVIAGPVQVTGSVGLTGAPLVIISGTPTVTVANQPEIGQPVFDLVQAHGDSPGDVTGAFGNAVPAGKRRIVTMMSANMFCPVGKNAFAAVFSPTGQFFLPLQPLYTDTVLNKSVYVMTMQTNLTMLPGNQFYALVHSDGSGCLLTVTFSGTEVFDQQ